MDEELPDPIHWRVLQYKIRRLEKAIDTFPEKYPKKATSQRLLDILHDQSQKIALRIFLWIQKATEEHLCQLRERQILLESNQAAGNSHNIEMPQESIMPAQSSYPKRLSMRLMRFSDHIDLTDEFDDLTLCVHYINDIIQKSQIDHQRNAILIGYNLNESETLSIEH